MLIQKNITNQLKDFRLNTYESKLWIALLSRGIATAGELSDIAEVPRSRAYDVLEGLEKKGFLIMKIGKPIKYLALEPEHVIEGVRNRILEEAETRVEMVKKLESSEVLNELKLLHKTGIKKINPTDFSGIFKGRKRVMHNIDKKIKNAKNEILIQTTESGIIKDKENLRQAIKKAKDNNVKIRIAAPITPDNKKAVKELSNYAEVRHTNTPGRFYIFDGTETVFMVLNDAEVHHSYDSAVWIKSPFFTSALQKMFTSSWNTLPKAQLE